MDFAENLKIIREEVEERVDEDGTKVRIIRQICKLVKSYQSSKDNILRYQEENKEKLNEYKKNRYKQKYAEDDEFREREKQRLREYNRKKKSQK